MSELKGGVTGEAGAGAGGGGDRTGPPGAGSGAPRRPSRLRLILIALVVAPLLWLAWELITWPNVRELADSNPASTAFMRRDARRNGTSTPTLQWAAYERLSPHLKRAALVSEDINFFTHDGFDRGEIKKAIEEARRDNEAPRGASTITQQLAKNLWLSPARTPVRKLKELLLTREMEQHLEKRRILEIYLNVVEFGPGVWGAPAAAEKYFGTSAANLSERQAAELTAGLSRPSIWHPGATTKSYRRHVERIIGRMEKATFLRGQIGGRQAETTPTPEPPEFGPPVDLPERAPEAPDSLPTPN